MKNRERDLFRLTHMLESNNKILELVALLETFEAFKNSWIGQDAMIRNFEIIGEASIHVSDETKNKYSNIEWQKMKGMRNFMSHEYFGIHLQTIWNTATNNIPILKIQIENIIADLRQEGSYEL